MINLGIIGYGSRVGNAIMKHIVSHGVEINIAAIADTHDREIREKLEAEGKNIAKTNFYSDADNMLENEKLDGIIVGTRCSSHAAMAAKVLLRRIPMLLEKPVATNIDDLLYLRNVYKNNPGKVVVAFVLRFAPILRIVKEIIDSGKIGTVEHVQAVNNVTYGGVYYHHWFRDDEETGGLFLQKATHDLDYINYVLGIQPVKLCAMESKQIFKGNKPAGLKCVDCDEKDVCPESLYCKTPYMKRQGGGEHCCFAEDTGNHDSASILVRYETGMHVSYSQNFFIRNVPVRGARFIGYKGNVDFDFIKGEATVTMHQFPRTETYKVDNSVFPDNHYGGDPVFTKHFLDVIMNNAESESSLDAGMLSALMCLAAKKSAEQNKFLDICWSGQQ
jgi:predicted dehydrogenase